mmetsp:Transcript_23954/g.55558  ORF Transcript_23954/g.55558 Transcript_23954/m.55558 type:complete len:84 (+) Transcript_23954:653-904(+)
MHSLPALSLQRNTSAVDPFSPEYGRFPGYEAREAELVRATCGAGDALYIPRRWWHSVRTSKETSASLSINFWWPPKRSHWGHG